MDHPPYITYGYMIIMEMSYNTYGVIQIYAPQMELQGME